MLTKTKRRLRQKTTGDIYIWTALLAERNDMEEIDPSILETPKEESPEDRAKRERAEIGRAKRLAALPKAQEAAAKKRKAQSEQLRQQREKNKRIGEARAAARLAAKNNIQRDLKA